MIQREFYYTREDGVSLFKTYSDNDFYIRQIPTGVLYINAIDIDDAPYTYEETNTAIDRKEILNKDIPLNK